MQIRETKDPGHMGNRLNVRGGARETETEDLAKLLTLGLLPLVFVESSPPSPPLPSPFLGAMYYRFTYYVRTYVHTCA